MRKTWQVPTRFVAALLLALAAPTMQAPSALAQALPQFAAPPPAAQSPLPAYRLGTGDRLRVTVFGHDNLSGEFEVDAGGAVALPLVGSVTVASLTQAEAEAAIIRALKPDYLKNPRVSIQILNYRPFYIVGEIKSPGRYPYVSGMTVINAIAIAGGFTYRARETRMTIIRAGEAERKKLDATPETPVWPGDVIEVQERFF